jgi:hypothetical protein
MPTRYRGVGDRAKPWQSKVQLAGETYWLGVYRTREEAAIEEHKFKEGLVRITYEAHRLWKEEHLRCPHCGGGLFIGATGLDQCRTCDGLSRNGKVLERAS